MELDKDKRLIYNFKGEIGIDSTVVEILPDDKVLEDLFLKTELIYMDHRNEIKDKEIYIMQFPEEKEKELKYSEGKILSILNTEFTHNATTLESSSGSPIILKNTKKIIGIHKKGNINNKENYGDFLYPIIKILEDKKKT